MSDQPANALHLPSLSITGFRGIDRLSIGRLGRVTLLAGRNGVGKTTVLDAVRVYATRGRPNVLNELLERREEVATAYDEDQAPVVSPDYAALFHGWAAIQASPITIGPNGGTDDLRIEAVKPGDWSPEQTDPFADLSTEADVQAVKIVYHGKERVLPWFLAVNERRPQWARRRYIRNLQRGWFEESEWPVINYEVLGPGLPTNSGLASLWDNVALTEEEDLAIKALRLILDDSIDRVAVVGDDESRHRGHGLRVVAKLRDHPRPVPLKSLGDGAIRMFAAGLGLANSRGGFLLIDEVENGIHYSVQRDFWRMILRAAHNNNVQVLATTHSWDCATGFARAASECADIEGVLFRLERNGDGVRAIEYTEEELETAAVQGIEVR